MIEIKMLFDSDFTEKDRDNLRNQGVSLNDWDYMVIVEDDLGILFHIYEGEWQPSINGLGSILNGVCENRWYKIKIGRKIVMVGVAYHA